MNRFSTVVLALGLGVGCSSNTTTTDLPETLTYDEFKAQAFQEPGTGNFIINGDELVESEEAMQSLYDSYLQSVSDAADRADGLATIQQGLIVNRVGGVDDKWSASAAQNITYCVSQKGFGSRYSAVVSAMSSAAGAWESATGGGVNFVHDSSQDGNCTSRNRNVVFDVNQVTTSQYLARAFFPSSSRRSRNVLISTSSFGNIAPWTLAGVLRHELGHTIGFRHEHTRPESGTCFEDTSWRALTAYDSSSVMHYPQCNGTNNGDLVLTNSDKTGAAALY
ncbi:MAG: M57 family metalloprotease [Kofleriaceae bacterium]